jgi:hypothetical protein
VWVNFGSVLCFSVNLVQKRNLSLELDNERMKQLSLTASVAHVGLGGLLGLGLD